MDMKPQRGSAKRQKLLEKIKSSGSDAKVMAEVQQALVGYKQTRTKRTCLSSMLCFQCFSLPLTLLCVPLAMGAIR